jgi:general secretion pathway protein C
MQRAQICLPGFSVAAGWIAALGLTAWLAAGWFWRLTAPEPVALVTQQMADPQAAARSVTQRHLFGDGGTTPGSAVAPPARNFTLVGAMTASRGQPGFAVLAETGKPAVSVFEGEEVAPGVRLEKVLADKVSIVRNGRSETLELVLDRSSAIPMPLPSASTGAPQSIPPNLPNP